MRFSINHWVCCNDNLTMCGKEASEEVDDSDETPDPNCRKCNRLYEFPCELGCSTAWRFGTKPYITRGKKKWSAKTALKEIIATPTAVLASIEARIRSWS